MKIQGSNLSELEHFLMRIHRLGGDDFVGVEESRMKTWRWRRRNE